MPQHTIARIAKLQAALATFEVLRQIEQLCSQAIGTPQYVGLDAAREVIQRRYERLYAEYQADHDGWKAQVKGIISQLDH